jgi:uncharacterized UPF0146 family protein
VTEESVEVGIGVLNQASEAVTANVQVALATDAGTVDDVHLHQIHAVEGDVRDPGIRDLVTSAKAKFKNTCTVLTQNFQT